MLVTGVDLIGISRIEQAVNRWGERFTRRVWTTAELEYCANRMASLAGRWAAKEATAKALGVGLRGLGAASHGVRWTEIEIVGTGGRPTLRLAGAAAERAAALGITQWSISLSHSDGLTLAFVVGLAGESGVRGDRR